MCIKDIESSPVINEPVVVLNVSIYLLDKSSGLQWNRNPNLVHGLLIQTLKRNS